MIKNLSLCGIVCIIALLFVVSSCTTKSIGQSDEGQGVPSIPTATVRQLPTLYPTPTQYPTAIPTNTRVPEPTAPTSTPIDFNQVAVDIRYSIPLLSLDRRIVGRVANKIELTDSFRGIAVIVPDQPGVLVELQQAVNQLELKELPPSCSGCVAIEYQLPLENKSGAGWLQDIRLLASLENYTTAHLGPHFPPGAVFGLRQSATAEHVARTVTVTDSNQLWVWQATDEQVPPATNSGLIWDLRQAMPDSPILSGLENPRFTGCPTGPGVEHLLIVYENETLNYEFTCPQLSMASSLLPIYRQLVDQASGELENTESTSTDHLVKLESIIEYHLLDGTGFSVNSDGSAILRNSEGISKTAILTPSLVISATNTLIDDEFLKEGVDNFLIAETENFLFLRGELKTYSYSWVNEDDSRVAIISRELEKLMSIVQDQSSKFESSLEQKVQVTPPPDGDASD